MTEDTQPYFDDTRRALAFALNYKGDVKAPTMTRILAQVQKAPRRVSKAARKRFLSQIDADAHPELARFMEALLQGRAYEGKKKTPWAPASPRGLDGAHLSGFILAHFARLIEHQQAILKARVIRAYSACSCGSPCCSGWRKHPGWAKAIVDTCEHLSSAGDVIRQPGKRGLSSQPALRLAIVEQFFTNGDMTITELSQLGRVSMETAAKHREWIRAYLEQEETNAWKELDLIFDAAGITGVFA